MSTEIVFIQGKAKWVRIHTPDEWGNYRAIIYPNAKGLETINRMKKGTDTVQGIKNVLKKDEDGYFMNFSRPVKKEFRGKVQAFTPPEVLDKDGITPLKGVNIGNGSDVTYKLTYYTFNIPRPMTAQTQGSACRLESIRVDHLIPFVKDNFTEAEKKQIAGLDEQPSQEQLF
jgi:hypothetical protein